MKPVGLIAVFLKGGLELIQKLTAAQTDDYTLADQAESLGLPKNFTQMCKEILGEENAEATVELDLTNGENSMHLKINTKSGLKHIFDNMVRMCASTDKFDEF